MAAGRFGQILNVASSLAMIVAAGSVTWAVFRPASERPGSARPAPVEPALPSVPIRIDRSESSGNIAAPVALLIYSDFECPFCARFAKQTLPEVRSKYVETSKVLLAFRSMPLESIHRYARAAADVAECSRRQEKLWQVHDRFFEDPVLIKSRSPVDLVAGLGLDLSLLRSCLASSGPAAVQSTIREAATFGIRGTPGFLLGRFKDGELRVSERFSGALAFDQLAKKIEGALSK
jgi:protein-disulfide isomerase